MPHRPFTQDKPSYRPARMAQRIKEELSLLVPDELKDPRVDNLSSLTITSVDLAPDYRNASILFVLSEADRSRADEVEQGLNSAAGFLRQELKPALGTKITPHLHFKYDWGLEKKTKIESLLQQIKKDEVTDK